MFENCPLARPGLPVSREREVSHKTLAWWWLDLTGVSTFINQHRWTLDTFSSPLNTAPAGALTEATLGWADSQLLTPSRWMVRPDSLKNIFSLMAFYVRQSDWMPHGALPESLTCIFVPSKCSKCSKNSNNDIKSGHRRKSCKSQPVDIIFWWLLWCDVSSEEGGEVRWGEVVIYYSL